MKYRFSPIAGSNTACAACSSPTGVLSHIFFSFIATGESSAVATGKKEKRDIKKHSKFQQTKGCIVISRYQSSLLLNTHNQVPHQNYSLIRLPPKCTIRAIITILKRFVASILLLFLSNSFHPIPVIILIFVNPDSVEQSGGSGGCCIVLLLSLFTKHKYSNISHTHPHPHHLYSS